VDYASAQELQQAAACEAAKGGPETLFLLEHPPTITFGRNGGAEHLPFSPAFFAERGISLMQADRGGSITCHFPGQMVAYPVMRLDRRPGGLRRFFHDLEESVIRTLARFGLSASREPGRPGVWVQGRKICSTGIAVQRWISTHGLSLNLSTDLALFDLVSPCGLAGVRATSVQREHASADITMPMLKGVFIQEFCAVFGLEPVKATALLPPACSDAPPRLPQWLRRPLPSDRSFGETRALVRDLGLATVCQSAKCPNMHECFSCGTATFLILGKTCTRNCAFCNIESGFPEPPDPTEPARVAAAARDLALSHIVVTSVSRDDLPDGGAAHFKRTILALRESLPQSSIEVLIPDFMGSPAALQTVIAAGPDVINHNVETHPSLYKRIRPQADFSRSLDLLSQVKESGIQAKSGFMVGLGESDEQVRELLYALKTAGCSIVTIGQYMRPSKKHLPPTRYVHPDRFAEYAEWGKAVGIDYVFSAPLVRSSYQAEESLAALRCE